MVTNEKKLLNDHVSRTFRSHLVRLLSVELKTPSFYAKCKKNHLENLRNITAN